MSDVLMVSTAELSAADRSQIYLDAAVRKIATTGEDQQSVKDALSEPLSALGLPLSWDFTANLLEQTGRESDYLGTQGDPNYAVSNLFNALRWQVHEGQHGPVQEDGTRTHTDNVSLPTGVTVLMEELRGECPDIEGVETSTTGVYKVEVTRPNAEPRSIYFGHSSKDVGKIKILSAQQTNSINGDSARMRVWDRVSTSGPVAPQVKAS